MRQEQWDEAIRDQIALAIPYLQNVSAESSPVVLHEVQKVDEFLMHDKIQICLGARLRPRGANLGCETRV